MSSGQNVFGAGLSVGLGYQFDPAEFFKRPSTILRLISWFFSIIVFGCISSGCYVDKYCIIGLDTNACGFGIFVGAVAFVACIAFLIMDALFDRLSSAQHRRYAILADIGFSAAWAFFYFVSFCYLTNRQINTHDIIFIGLGVQPWQIGNARASIAFSFFSIGTFCALVFFAVQKLRQGEQNAFPPSSQIESQIASGNYDQQEPYHGGLPKPESGFQEPPFSGGDGDGENSANYERPAY